jgi:hypothetical protein
MIHNCDQNHVVNTSMPPITSSPHRIGSRETLTCPQASSQIRISPKFGFKFVVLSHIRERMDTDNYPRLNESDRNLQRDNTDSDVPSPKHGEPWFNDGNIVLQAESTQFKVYGGIYPQTRKYSERCSRCRNLLSVKRKLRGAWL